MNTWFMYNGPLSAGAHQWCRRSADCCRVNSLDSRAEGTCVDHFVDGDCCPVSQTAGASAPVDNSWIGGPRDDAVTSAGTLPQNIRFRGVVIDDVISRLQERPENKRQGALEKTLTDAIRARVPRYSLMQLMAAAAKRGLTISRVVAAAVHQAPEVRVNFRHLFHGEINRRGCAVGFHHAGSIGHHGRAGISSIIDPPNGQGVYRARVKIFNPATCSWVRKREPSTFFPAAWSRCEVINEIRGAYANVVYRRGPYFIGVSPGGMRIAGQQVGSRHIGTAFPEY